MIGKTMKDKISFRSICRIIVVCLIGMFAPWHVPATVTTLDFVAAASATDEGPQDGVFDAFLIPSDELAVNNNGFTSLRGAVEFDLAGIPSDVTINAATLSLLVNFVEGTRQIELHGYAGDGSVSLGDFSRNGLVNSTTLNPPGSEMVLFDATAFLSDLVTTGGSFAGFNLREEPANDSNFIVLFFAKDGPPRPRLSIDFTP